MFFSLLVSTARLCLGPPKRHFSATSIVEKYKLKSHQGAKKRWRSLPNGTFKRGKAGIHHKNVGKPPVRRNRLGQTAYSTKTQTVKLHKKLLPYGTS